MYKAFKKLAGFGSLVQKGIDSLKFLEKVSKTITSALKHLQAFENDRKSIWNETNKQHSQSNTYSGVDFMASNQINDEEQ